MFNNDYFHFYDLYKLCLFLWFGIVNINISISPIIPIPNKKGYANNSNNTIMYSFILIQP